MSSLVLLLLYLLPLTLLFVYCLVQLSLIIKHFKYEKSLAQFSAVLPTQLPKVTLQLPIYNEKYVAQRIIEAVIGINYPKDLLEIQVLDDSNDETVAIIAEQVKYYAAKGFDIQHIQRPNRVGYKAGALQYGLETAKGEFVAIFDADFVPPTDFLMSSIGYFENKEVGMVQTRWEHLNPSFSLLTKMQEFGLDAHFFIEQTGRFAGNHFINFNGTAGIWRKATILDAGSWSADTLTEDLDLSYRAQLKSWKFIYLRNLASPAELPVSMQAIKSQQYRWMKGGAECFRKNAFNLAKSNKKDLSTKVHGWFHLLNSSIFLAVLSLALFSVPLIFQLDVFSKYASVVNITALFQVNWLILGAFYWLAFRRKNKSFLKFAGMFLMFLIFMMGMSLHNSLAVIEGLIGRKTPFIRTPKFNVKNTNDSWQKNTYINAHIGWLTIAELVLGIFFFVMLIVDIQKGVFGMIPFHFMVFVGFMLVSLTSIKQSFSLR